MEQVYNYTQDIPGVHANGIKNYAAQIQKKASQLRSTAGSQSTQELTTTRNYDIQGDSGKGTNLQKKAQKLRDEAKFLHDKAGQLAQEAAKSSNPLKPLETLAQTLKNAAKQSGQDHLYGAANELATGRDGLENKANAVITKFGEVQQAHTTLSELPAYKQVIEGKSNLEPDQQQKVKAVEKEYNNLVDKASLKSEFEAVKKIYVRILNLTKLKIKATALKTAATGLGTLPGAATALEGAVTTLRDGTGPGSDHTNAKKVESQYGSVQSAYNALPEDQMTNVQAEFQALNSAYGHIGSITFPDLLIPNLNNNS